MSSPFVGLSAFPLTPADVHGRVDTDALAMLLHRLVDARVDSIGLLGSTGTYAYLDRGERLRAVAAAVEVVAGRVPLIVGIGALRTSWAVQLAQDAERAGADGLLLAPMSYTPLTDGEVAEHFRTVVSATSLPLCIYNNPGTTRFTFSDALIEEVAAIPGIAAIKMPLPAEGDYEGQLSRLRGTTPGTFAIGYSGDWGIAPSLLAGSDGFYSAIGGILPDPVLRLARAAQASRVEEAHGLDAAFAPLSALVRAHGGLRISYAIADILSLQVGDPPRPIRRVDATIAAEVEKALATMRAS